MPFCIQYSNELMEPARLCPSCAAEVGPAAKTAQTLAPGKQPLPTREQVVQMRVENGAPILTHICQIPKDIGNMAMLYDLGGLRLFRWDPHREHYWTTPCLADKAR